MDTTQPQPVRRHLARAATSAARLLLTAVVVTQAFGLAAEHPDRPAGQQEAGSCCNLLAAQPSAATVWGDADPEPGPDVTAGHVGGIAARLHTSEGARVPGDVFYLMATAGSDAAARLYDDTPYIHTNGIADDTHESNLDAGATVSSIAGVDVAPIEFTSPPGGGPSGGLTYTIAYLNLLSDGAFTGDLRVAATGRIDADGYGYVDLINAIDEKTAAASLARADVLFTPSAPSDDHVDAYGAREVGEVFRTRHSGDPLQEERQLDNYFDWGADRPDGMDIVYVKHVADVAAYLCGTGSTAACDVAGPLADTTTEFASTDPETHHGGVEFEPAGVR